MAFIEWEDRLSVKVALFDDQHKGLVELINTLHDVIKAGETNNASLTTELLIYYTVAHFRNEETLFQEYGYPEFEQHRKEHEDFKKDVIEFKARLTAGEAVESSEFLDFLMNWLKKHILGTDNKYTAFLNARGVV